MPLMGVNMVCIQCYWEQTMTFMVDNKRALLRFV